jgi:hypothetical protein
MDKLYEIKKHLKEKHYHLEDFWLACPYTFEELIANRKYKRIIYLHIGMVWARLSGLSTLQTGEMFKRHHSTVTHAEQCVLNTLESVKFGKKEYLEVIEKVLYFYKVNSDILDVVKTEDTYQDHYASMVFLENKAYQLVNKRKIWKNA